MTEPRFRWARRMSGRRRSRRGISTGAIIPTYFLKEITEAVHSVRKTLRGKYRIERDREGEKVVFNLGEDIVPERIREALTGGAIRRIIVIGHGTAAVAGSAVADAMESRLKGSGIRVEAKIASELSGFCLEKDLHDTLVIPITQSGTTTDTNRAVAMAAERGAAVIAIVNRRQSDITTKADGVFYTSDGRDIEMAVASTKAFYSQIVAGRILALYLALTLKTLSGERIAMELRRLEQTPALMQKVLDRKEEIRLAVEKTGKAEAILGRRGERAEQGGGRRDPDQAERALLQDDLFRRHREQEAHRSVRRTADHRLRRGKSGGGDGGRRQGCGDLQGPQVLRDRLCR